MRLISTIMIVLFAPGLVILAYQNVIPVQEENYQHEFDTPPRIVGGFQALQDKIVYPEEAKRQNIEGRVIVEISISSQGKVTDASIAEGIEKGKLNNAALVAVKKISFSPALRDGKPIAVRVHIPIRFSLDSNSDTGSLIYLKILDANYCAVNGENLDYEFAVHSLAT